MITSIMKLASLIIKLIIIINVTVTFTIAQPTVVRCCFGSAIAGNKIYVGGGLTTVGGEAVDLDDFFSLDLTNRFSTLSPIDMPYEIRAKVPVLTIAHTFVYAKNAKGGMIYLFGGHRATPVGSPIYGYSLGENAWTAVTPKVRNGVIIPAESTTKIIGVTDSSFVTVYVFDNRTMYIYDVWNNFWDAGKDLAPLNLEYYAAVMLNTSEIAYIGGYDGTSNLNVPLSQILLFNTKTSSWYTKATKAIDSEIPSPRNGHSASIAPDGRIFVYGGFDDNSNGSNPTFAVLEYVNGEFEWSSPPLLNQSSVMRVLHTSHIYENYLFIVFGRNLTNNRLNTIDLINISSRDSYSLVTDFVPTTVNSAAAAQTETQSTPSISSTASYSTTASPSITVINKDYQNNAAIIVASVSSAVVGFFIIMGISYMCYRRRRSPIPTPEVEVTNHYPILT